MKNAITVTLKPAAVIQRHSSESAANSLSRAQRIRDMVAKSEQVSASLEQPLHASSNATLSVPDVSPPTQISEPTTVAQCPDTCPCNVPLPERICVRRDTINYCNCCSLGRMQQNPATDVGCQSVVVPQEECVVIAPEHFGDKAYYLCEACRSHPHINVWLERLFRKAGFAPLRVRSDSGKLESPVDHSPQLRFYRERTDAIVTDAELSWLEMYEGTWHARVYFDHECGRPLRRVSLPNLLHHNPTMFEDIKLYITETMDLACAKRLPLFADMPTTLDDVKKLGLYREDGKYSC